MNIFNKTALQGMKNSPARTAVTIVGAALSTAMVTAVFTFVVSLQQYMVNNAVVKYGQWHVFFSDADESFRQSQEEDGRVSGTAAFENIGYAVLEGGENEYKPYLFLAGFDRETFGALPVKLISGRLPENSGEVLVPAHVATNGGVDFAVGDRLTLAVGSRRAGDGATVQTAPHSAGDGALVQTDPFRSGEKEGTVREEFVPVEERTYTVVGICGRPSFEPYTAPGYTLITIKDGERQGSRLSVFVALAQPWQLRSYVESVSEKMGEEAGHGLNDNVLRFMGLSQDRMFNTLLYSAGGILAVLIMLGSVFLIYNSFTISLNDRMRQFGILLSVGAMESQLRRCVLFEGLCIGAAGIPLGILTGIPGIRLVLSLVRKDFSNILYDAVPLTLYVSVPAIAAAAGVGLATILASAYLPARKAAAVPVMECIRQTNEIKVEPKAVRTSAMAECLYGFEGTLAWKNFKRNKGRYRSIVLSLALSVVLFISADSFGAHLKQIAGQSVVDSEWDISFYGQEMEENQIFRLYDQLKSAEGVSEGAWQMISAYSCVAGERDFAADFSGLADLLLNGGKAQLALDICFVPENVIVEFARGMGLSAEEYTGRDAKLFAVARGTDGAGMFGKESMEFVLGGKSGWGKRAALKFVDALPVEMLPGRPVREEPYVFMALASYQEKDAFEAPGVPVEAGFYFRSKNPSRSVGEMEAALKESGLADRCSLYNYNELFEEGRNAIFVVNLFSIVFVVMISLIAAANVFNTISTNIRLRRRELAMLRSVGMADRGFNRMMRFECALYGMRTLLAGVPAAWLVSWLIYWWLSEGGRDMDFIFPWASTGISMLGVFLVISATMLYATGRLRRENIIDALRDDMT